MLHVHHYLQEASWTAKTALVMFSAIPCPYASLSACKTLATPSTLAAAAATSADPDPATKTVTSPPIAFAAVIAFKVAPFKAALLCSART